MEKTAMVQELLFESMKEMKKLMDVAVEENQLTAAVKCSEKIAALAHEIVGMQSACYGAKVLEEVGEMVKTIKEDAVKGPFGIGTLGSPT